MSRSRSTLLSAFAVTVLWAVAPSAFAANTLPSFLFLTETGTATLKAESATAKTAFTGIENLTGTGYKFALTIEKNMTSLGPGTLDFLATKLLGKACNTTGDAAGTELL